jgi:acid phosphatase (class A)
VNTRHKRKVCTLVLVLLAAVLGGIRAFGQAPAEQATSKSAAPQPRARVTGYLAEREPDFLNILPPYPAFGSMHDEADVTTLWQWQHSETSRWQLASTDEEMSYNRFSQAFGTEINRATAPLLIHLLDRAERDVQGVAFDAKSFYNRPRPFQRFQLARVCGTENPPVPEVPLKGGSSYPSGHTSFGWATALILAEVAPERAQQLLARGSEYGESRVVCAMHYTSDVVGGQLVATAVVARLHSVPEFSRDLACAKEEYEAADQPNVQMSAECLTLKKELDSKAPPTQ